MEEQDHEKWIIDVVPGQEGSPNVLSRRDVLGMSCAAFAMVLLQGCGGGGGGGNGGGGNPQEDFFRATNVAVKDEVVILPSDGSLIISDVTETGLKLSGAVPALVAGSVIVSGVGAGLMRKVVSATPSGADTVLVTEDAALTDVFNSAKVEFRQSIGAEHIDHVEILLDGVEVGGAVPAAAGRSRVAQSIGINIPKTFVGEGEGNERVGLEVQAQGTLSMAVIGDFEITLANGLERLQFATTGIWDGVYGLKLIGEREFPRKEIPYATVIFSPIPFAIGPVPVLLLPVLFLQVATLGKVIGGWESTGNGRAVGSLAMAYIQNPAGSDFTLDNLAVSSTASHTGTFNTSNFFGQVRVEVIPCQAELQLSLNGVFGPTFKGDLPAIAAELKANLSNNTVDFFSDAIFRGKVGAKAGMMGMDLPLWEMTVAEHKIPIKYRTFKPGDGNVGIS